MPDRPGLSAGAVALAGTPPAGVLTAMWRLTVRSRRAATAAALSAEAMAIGTDSGAMA